jgi:hypothetical protein
MREPNKEQCKEITRQIIDQMNEIAEQHGIDTLALDALLLGVIHSRLEMAMGREEALKACENSFYCIGWKPRPN